MSATAKTKPVEVRNFDGLVSNADERDIPPGAARDMLNMQHLRAGVLSVRKGLVKDSTTTASSPTAFDLIALYNYRRPQGSAVVSEDSNGVVRYRAGSAATSIKTGLNAFWPLCFAPGRNGDLYAVNGINRGLRWDGLTASAEQLGMDAPVTDPTVTSAPGSGSLTYKIAYRYIDDTLPTPIPSNISDLGSVATASASDAFTHNVTAPTQTRAVKVEFWRSLADNFDRLYLVTTQGARGTITDAENNGSGAVRITSADHNLTTGARVTVSDVGGATGANGSHEVTRIDDDTFDLQGSTFGGTYTSGGSWVIIGYADDELTDAQLAAKTGMNVTNADGTLSALQHTPPPRWPSVAVRFQDRMVYGVPVPYDQGTVSTTDGSTTITGTSTGWSTEMSAAAGDLYLYIEGHAAPLPVSSIGSATSITTTVAASASLSNKAYALAPSPEYFNTILISQQDKPESVPLSANNEIVIQNNVGDDDRLTALYPFGSVLLAFKQRHVYRVSWVVQPQTDAAVHLTDYRGAVNQRCVAAFEGTIYAIDQAGAWMMNRTGGAMPISAPIQNLWRDGTLDFTNTKWWFVQVDPEQRVVRFHVSYAADSETYPSRWLEWNVDAKQWSTGKTYVGQLGGACLIERSGRARVLAGGEDDRTYLFHEAETDGVSAQIRGTATGATATTLSDSAAPFTADALIGVPVAIISGTGKGQIRRITANTTTQLTVATWTTTPDTTSVYLVGAVEWNWTSKRFEFLESTQHVDRSLGIRYLPTTGDGSLDLRMYLDWRTSLMTMAQATMQDGTRWSRDAGGNDSVLNLKDENGIPGYEKHRWSGNLVSDTHGNRWWSFAMRGFQGDDAIELYGFDLLGVRG